jgi:hypothetical protein
VVAPGMLQNPLVKSWLGGIEPAWTLLDDASFAALSRPPSPSVGPIRLASDLKEEEIRHSAVARNALILLRAAAAGSGLKTTATGNLSRNVVAEMYDRFTWPGFDRTNDFPFDKAINEPDFLPLFFLRHVAQAGKILRRSKGHLRITPGGRRMLEEPHLPALQAVLFHIAFWHLDLGYFGPDLHHGWPQYNAGVVLWSLSVAANDWQPPERLTRLCTIPSDSVLDNRWDWDTASYVMDAQILRPLKWFGLLEQRADEIDPGRYEMRHFYRKTALFDRFLSFDVRLETADAPHH